MVRRMDKWLTTMNHRIDEYRKLEQDWNGYDAPPFTCYLHACCIHESS